MREKAIGLMLRLLGALGWHGPISPTFGRARTWMGASKGESREPLSRRTRIELELRELHPLRCIVRVPAVEPISGLPLLCFLHGYDEGAPVDIIDALTRHGPLREGNPREWIDRFVIVAPQLPVRGDLWRRYAPAVREIVLAEAWRYRCDVNRLYLTGFSFGANGVFDLALEQRDVWSAAWAVDPTRVPPRALDLPIRVSIGQASRHQASAFVRRLGLAEAGQDTDRIWTDEGADHVGTARRAYRDARVYDWLLRQVKNEEAGKNVAE
jgi:hypothetical protein